MRCDTQSVCLTVKVTFYVSNTFALITVQYNFILVFLGLLDPCPFKCADALLAKIND